MAWFSCPYLDGQVELTEERERHIAERHPDLLPQYRDRIAETLSLPDEIRRSRRFSDARLFARWHADVRGGKYIVVVVLGDSSAGGRYWVITA